MSNSQGYLSRGWWGVAAALLLLGASHPAEGEWRFVSTLDAEESFDSNIYLHPDHETSDLITTLTPGFTVEDATATRTLAANYSLALITFSRHTGENYVGHSAGLSWDQQLSRAFSWHLRDTFYRTTEPREPGEPGEDGRVDTSVRETRNEYYRNTAEAGLSYQFGREDRLSLLYSDSRLQNQDPRVEDTLEYGPGVEVEYWLTPRHGVRVSHLLLLRKYETDPDDKTESTGLGYRWRWSPQTTVRLDYQYKRYSSQDPRRRDYNIHATALGLAKDLGPTWAFDASLGYYYWDPDGAQADDGISYILSLGKTFSRGDVRLTGEGGVRADYTDAERRGFTKYRGVSLSVTRNLAPRLDLRAESSFLHEEFPEVEDRVDETWDASLVLTYQILRWLSGGLELTHTERASSDSESEYRDSIALIRFSALHEWR